MKITVRNIKHENITRKQLIDAMSFFAETLMGKRLPPKLNLEVKFRDIEEYGLCTVDDAETYPRYFTIDVRKGLKFRDIISTVAHEMTHVKQFARRELVNFDTHRSHAKFNGKSFDIGKTEYWLYPHELEAFGYEVALTTMYLQKIEYKDD